MNPLVKEVRELDANDPRRSEWFHCLECKGIASVDEDGCCSSCGSDTTVLVSYSPSTMAALAKRALQLADLVETLEGEKERAIKINKELRQMLDASRENTRNTMRERNEARRDLEDCRRGPRPSSTASSSSFAAAFDALNADEE